MQASVRATPDTAEDAVVQLTLTIGRRFRIANDGIEPSQAALLHALKCRGAMRLSDLAASMRLDASTVSRHVRQLGERGLVDRSPDPQDGRAQIVTLSKSGIKALQTTLGQRRAILNDVLKDWEPADREQLRHQLGRLTAALQDNA